MKASGYLYQLSSDQERQPPQEEQGRQSHITQPIQQSLYNIPASHPPSTQPADITSTVSLEGTHEPMDISQLRSTASDEWSFTDDDDDPHDPLPSTPSQYFDEHLEIKDMNDDTYHTTALKAHTMLPDVPPSQTTHNIIKRAVVHSALQMC